MLNSEDRSQVQSSNSSIPVVCLASVWSSIGYLIRHHTDGFRHRTDSLSFLLWNGTIFQGNFSLLFGFHPQFPLSNNAIPALASREDECASVCMIFHLEIFIYHIKSVGLSCHSNMESAQVPLMTANGSLLAGTNQ